MPRLAALAVLALLALPAVASAEKRPAGSGSLVVQNGRGFVVVAAKGGIIGRFDSGQIRIGDPIPGDGKVIVYGAEKRRVVDSDTTIYIGDDVHFYIGGLYRVRIDALGINLSAVGKGTATLSSTGFLDPGVYKVDDAPFQPLPDVPAKVTLGTSP